jgi:hypothetical protein
MRSEICGRGDAGGEMREREMREEQCGGEKCGRVMREREVGIPDVTHQLSRDFAALHVSLQFFPVLRVQLLGGRF